MKFFGVLLLLLLAGLLQNTEALSFFGIKPNLLLAMTIAASFFVSEMALYLFLVVAAVFLLKFSGGVELESLVFALAAVSAAWLGGRLHWRPDFNNLVLVAGGTLLFYLIADASYLVASWPQVLLELVYNLAVGMVLFKSFERWLKTSSMLKT